MRIWCLLLYFWIGFTSLAVARPSSMTAALLRAQGACFPLDSTWTPQWANVQGYWKLDDASGATTAADSSSNANTATAGNITFAATGRINTAATFNGTTSYIKVATMNSNLYTSTDSSYTLSAWAYISSLPATTCATNTSTCKSMIFGRNGTHMGILLLNSGALQGEYYTTGPTWRGATGATITTGKWYHFAMVVNDTAKTVQMYLNGRTSGSANSYAGQTLYAFGSSRPFVIGKASDTDALTNGNYAYPFSGKVDEAVVWNTALTAAQIKTIYDQQSCGLN